VIPNCSQGLDGGVVLKRRCPHQRDRSVKAAAAIFRQQFAIRLGVDDRRVDHGDQFVRQRSTP